MILLMIALAAAAPSTGKDEVEALVEWRDDCEHWQGEEPYSKQRAREIDRAIKSLKCDTLLAEARRMRPYYLNDQRRLGLIDDVLASLQP